MSSILILKDWDDCEIYGVFEFATPLARFRATEIIRDVKQGFDWSLDDVRDALENSGIEMKHYPDVEEYFI